MKLACIVLAHRLPQQVARLLATLRHPSIAAYLHVDERAEIRAFTDALAEHDLNPRWLSRRPTRWGGVEVVDVTLDGLRAGTADGCDYFVLISGQDFPLRAPERILEQLAAAPDMSYVRHWPLPAAQWRLGGRDRTDFYTFTVRGRRETCMPPGESPAGLSVKGRVLNGLLRARSRSLPPRAFPGYVRAFGGTQWLNLSRAAAEHVLGFVADHPDYRPYHEHTLLPDELFFHSILLGSDWPGRSGVVDDDRRFMVWPDGESHPRVLRVGDLDAMRASAAFFGRKFDETADAEVIARLEEEVLT